MKKTVLLVEIQHIKPLPTKDLEVTDVAAQRLYTWLLNLGISAEVSAKLMGAFDAGQ